MAPWRPRHAISCASRRQASIGCSSRARPGGPTRPHRHQARHPAQAPDPASDDSWDASRPGFIEADTVAHCGDRLAGCFVWSLTMTDLYSGWTECRATWNKGAHGVITQIKAIQKAMPFKLLGFDCDNGSEFLNWHLLRYFQHPRRRMQFTRSRPYRKNDNVHVEQKNWSCVQQLFGYWRFDNPTIGALIQLNNFEYQSWFGRVRVSF